MYYFMLFKNTLGEFLFNLGVTKLSQILSDGPKRYLGQALGILEIDSYQAFSFKSNSF